MYNVRMDFIRLNIRVPAQMIARLKAHMARTGLSVSEIVRRAIDQYLNREK